MELVVNFCPAMAVPTMVKMPEPMTAPMPSEVRLNQPRDFLRRSSAPSQSEMSLSMFLRRKRDEATQALRAHPDDANVFSLRAGSGVRCVPHFIVRSGVAQLLSC